MARNALYAVNAGGLNREGLQTPTLPPPWTQQVFPGTAGNDTINGTAGDDTFNMGDGGDDTVAGKGGNDTFNFGASLTAADAVDGGGGTDSVVLTGDYIGPSALAFGATTITGIETLVISGGSYDLTLDDANAVNDIVLTIDATALGSGQALTFDGSAETDTAVNIEAGKGDAFLTMGAGNDIVSFGGAFRPTDRIDGGIGVNDILELDGDYSGGLVFEPGTIRNIEVISVIAGHSYTLTIDNANTTIGNPLLIRGETLGAGDTLIFDGSDETSSRLVVVGGDGDDTAFTGGGNDEIALGKGTNLLMGGDGSDLLESSGTDTAFGGSGDDSIHVSDGTFTRDDLLDGGDGFDVLTVFGTFDVTAFPNTIRNIEQIIALSGFATLALNAANVAAGETLTINGLNTLTLEFDGRAVIDGHLRILGGSGFDTIFIGQSGYDIVRAGSNDDNILALANLVETDRIDGGTGAADTLTLNGDYSDRLEFGSRTVRSIDKIDLLATHSYNLASADGTVASGATMIVNGLGLGATDKLTFDGSKESNGAFNLRGGAGNDVLTGGAGNDTISTGNGTNTVDASRGGNDHITGGSGSDTIVFGAAYTSSDFVDAAGGTDTVLFDGDYSTATFTAPVVELMKFAAGNSYKFASASTTTTLTIQAGHLGPGDVLTFTANIGRVVITSGAGNDSLTGGDGNDIFAANLGDDILKGVDGQDTLSGGGGKNTFVFGAAGESTSITFDKILNADFSVDKLDVPGTVSAMDTPVASGALHNSSKAVFDSDLIGLMNGHLGAGHAILFVCNGGNFIGHVFLIVDENGTAEYQVDADLVMDVTGFAGTIGTSDFI